MYLALGITTTLYVLIALGVFGTLTVDEVLANGETALAEAAKPALGEAGFVMMAIAALLATSSSVNANIYAATGSTAKLAESGTFPPVFGQLARVGGTRGLVISVLAVLGLAYFVDLTAIASLGSAVALGDLPHHLARGLPPQSGNGVTGLGADHWHPAYRRRPPRLRRTNATN